MADDNPRQATRKSSPVINSARGRCTNSRRIFMQKRDAGTMYARDGNNLRGPHKDSYGSGNVKLNTLCIVEIMGILEVFLTYINTSSRS